MFIKILFWFVQRDLQNCWRSKSRTKLLTWTSKLRTLKPDLGSGVFSWTLFSLFSVFSFFFFHQSKIPGNVSDINISMTATQLFCRLRRQSLLTIRRWLQILRIILHSVLQVDPIHNLHLRDSWNNSSPDLTYSSSIYLSKNDHQDKWHDLSHFGSASS